MLIILVLAASTVLLDRLNGATRNHLTQDEETTRALAQAKAALIGWAADNPDIPGLLPFPDRNSDGNYDGSSDCLPVFTPVNASYLLGRFPWHGQHGPCLGTPAGATDLRDGSGAELWYAVSQNLVRNSDGTNFLDPMINSDWADSPTPATLPWWNDGTSAEDDRTAYPWLKVYDQNGNLVSNRVAAVIIAPGPPLSGQDRSGVAPGPANYLDSITIGGITFDNASITTGFINHPDTELNHDATSGAHFNDRLVYITIDELMRVVQRRVLGEVALALQMYRSIQGSYPWLAPFSNPETSDYVGTTGTSQGFIPNSVPTPTWFTRNGWNGLVLAAVANGFEPGGSGSCSSTTCITVLNAVSPPDDDKQVVLVMAGPQLSGQNRPSASLGDYFEGNNDNGDDILERQTATGTFNDEIRVVAP